MMVSNKQKWKVEEDMKDSKKKLYNLSFYTILMILHVL